MQETVIAARRASETKANPSKPAKAQPEIPVAYLNQTADAVADAKGEFTLRGLHAGSYRIDPQAPSAGWFIRSITIGSASRDTNVPRDGITLKNGERVSGLTVTLTEGAASLHGRISPEQSIPPGMTIFLVPAEKEAGENLLRFFETRAGSDGSFAFGNIPPGRYWLISRIVDESDPSKVMRVRQNALLRSQVLKEAESLKNEITLQPCRRLRDYELRYPPAPDSKSKQ